MNIKRIFAAAVSVCIAFSSGICKTAFAETVCGETVAARAAQGAETEKRFTGNGYNYNPKENYALGKKVTVNIEGEKDYPEVYMTDGDYATDWHSKKEFLQGDYAEFVLDLESVQTVNRFCIYANPGNILSYTLWYSADGEKYINIPEVTPKNQICPDDLWNVQRLKFNAVEARYLKLCVDGTKPYQEARVIAVNEFEVYNKNDELISVIERKPLVNESSIQTLMYFETDKINDGIIQSRCAVRDYSYTANGLDYIFDAGDEVNVNYLRLIQWGEFIPSYKLWYSSDNVNYKLAAEFNKPLIETRELITQSFDTVKGRYFKFSLTDPTQRPGINEIQLLYFENPTYAHDVYIDADVNMVAKKYYGRYILDNINDDLTDASKYQWYRAETEDGELTPISGANTYDYELTAEDCEKYLVFEVTPKTNADSGYGEPVKSAPVRVAYQTMLNKNSVDCSSSYIMHGKDKSFMDDSDAAAVPIMKNGRVMVLPSLFEKLYGSDFAWDGDLAPARLTVGGKEIIFSPNSAKMAVGDEYINLAAAPFNLNGRLYLPLNEILELIGEKIIYEKDGFVLFGKGETDKSVIPELVYQIKYGESSESLNKFGEKFFKNLDLEKSEMQVFKCLAEKGEYARALELYKNKFFDYLNSLDITLRMGLMSSVGGNAEELSNGIVAMNEGGAGKTEDTVKFFGDPGHFNWFPLDKDGMGLHVTIFSQGSKFVEAYNETGTGKYLENWDKTWNDMGKNSFNQYFNLYYTKDAFEISSFILGCGRNSPYFSSLQINETYGQLFNLAKGNVVAAKLGVRGSTLARMLERATGISLTGNGTNAISNQFVTASSIYVITGQLLSDFKDSENWTEQGTERLQRYLNSYGYLPDGTDMEQSNNYNEYLLTAFKDISDVFIGEWPQWFKDMLEKADYRMRYFSASSVQNSKQSALIGQDTIGSVSSLARKFSSIVSDPLTDTITDAYDNGGKGPNFTSIAFPYGGYYFLRNGWGKNDFYMFLNGARAGNGHSFNEANSIQLSAYGKDILKRAGAPSYGSEDLLMDEYLESSKGVSTVNVDGGVQLRLAIKGTNTIQSYGDTLKTRFYSSDSFAFAEGKYDSPYGKEEEGKYEITASDIVHNREVLFSNAAKLYIVADKMKADLSHTYNQSWGFSKDYTSDDFEIDGEEGWIISNKQNDVNVSLYNFTDSDVDYNMYYGQRTPEIRGWYRHGWGVTEPDKKVDIDANWRAVGDTAMVTLIIPRDIGTDESVKAVKNLSANGLYGFEAQLTDGRKVTYLTGNSNGNAISIGKIGCTGEFLLVIEDADGSISGMAGECSELSYGGRTVQKSGTNFEFSVKDGALKTEGEMIIPTGFKWIEEGDRGFNVLYK